MKLQNPFKLQNWNIKKFLLIILGIQLSLLELFALNNSGIGTPIIRPLIGFIYLSFIPGYLLLRILKLHKLSSIESFLYALGLSLFMDMLVGFLMNMLYPILSITDKPISEIPIVLTMTGVVLLLCFIAYLRDKDYNNPDFIDLKDILNPQVLFLSLIPFMAIFGTYLVNYYHNNILLMIMIVVIALVALVIGFTNWIDKKYYPYAIWVMAISLLYGVVLISNYILVNDIVSEFYNAKSTIILGLWNCSTPHQNANYNSLLATTILPSIYYMICNCSLTLIYKIMFPTLFSSISLGVYILISNITPYKKIPPISSLLFIFSITYYYVVSLIPRQAIAELFMTLSLVELFRIYKGEYINYNNLIILYIFSISVIFSHYGVSLIYFGMLFILSTYTALCNNNKTITKIFTIYSIMWFSWYIYINNSYTFGSIMGVFTKAIESTGKLFAISQSRTVVTMTAAPYNLLLKYIYYITTILIGIGSLSSIINKIRPKNSTFLISDNNYHLLFTLYLELCILIPMMIPDFGSIDVKRQLHILSLIATPYFIAGLDYILLSKISRDNLLRICSIFLAVFLIINISSVVIDNNPQKMESIVDKNEYYTTIIYTQDIYSSKWISDKINPSSKIYRLSVVLGYPSLTIYGSKNISPKFNIINIPPGKRITEGYVQLTYKNIVGKIGDYINPITKFASGRCLVNLTNISKIKSGYNEIYDNGGSQILLS